MKLRYNTLKQYMCIYLWGMKYNLDKMLNCKTHLVLNEL